jgi:ornithine cyclodeaminase/alanine dehydrogenase-like protein (mu-crystallin family)
VIPFLSSDDVRRLITIDDCIDAVERAFREQSSIASLSLHVDGGAFHVKAAVVGHYFAVKANANFFDNPSRGLPRIQGAILLSDATNGRPLAILDSIAITILRTGAATAVAAKHLARADARTLLVAGCGNQGRVSIDAIRRVRNIERVFVYDVDASRAAQLASDVGAEVVRELVDADIVVTCTPSRTAFLHDARAGQFIAAVGTDSHEKQEIAPSLLASSVVIVDDLAQCRAFGDLHHAPDVVPRASLGEVLRGEIAGRASDDEVVIFDSTGTALQDVAVAALAFERASS